MKKGYTSLKKLASSLNCNEKILDEIHKIGKENFSNNEDYINIGIGLISEIKENVSDINDDVFIINKKLYDTICPIIEYSSNLFNDYGFVNSYKLYDALLTDVLSLKALLNKFIEI